MKFVDHKQELPKLWLLLTWFHCESHWWVYTRQTTSLIANIGQRLVVN